MKDSEMTEDETELNEYNIGLLKMARKKNNYTLDLSLFTSNGFQEDLKQLLQNNIAKIEDEKVILLENAVNYVLGQLEATSSY